MFSTRSEGGQIERVVAFFHFAKKNRCQFVSQNVNATNLKRVLILVLCIAFADGGGRYKPTNEKQRGLLVYTGKHLISFASTVTDFRRVDERRIFRLSIRNEIHNTFSVLLRLLTTQVLADWQRFDTLHPE